MMSIGFDSDEIILEKLRARLRRMTDDELIRFGKDLRKLVQNPSGNRKNFVPASGLPEVQSFAIFLAEDEKKFSLSLGDGPCSVAMPTRALLSRRLQHDTPHDEVQRVGLVRM